MKGYDSLYNQVTGLNPIQQEIKDQASYLKSTAERVGVLGMLNGYFSAFSEITSDDVNNISLYSDSLAFYLGVKDSRFVHKLAQFTGLKFEKKAAPDGQSIQLDAKVPAEHPLSGIGISYICVSGYLPKSCKIVVESHKPISDDMKEIYSKLITEGSPVYKTVCSEPEPEPVEVQ